MYNNFFIEQKGVLDLGFNFHYRGYYDTPHGRIYLEDKNYINEYSQYFESKQSLIEDVLENNTREEIISGIRKLCK